MSAWKKNTVKIPLAVGKTRPGYPVITVIHSTALVVYLTRSGDREVNAVWLVQLISVSM